MGVYPRSCDLDMVAVKTALYVSGHAVTILVYNAWFVVLALVTVSF